ncbi:hypothetical protein ACUN0C_11695 [Faunimonas sp. B44]|uniref:hypothetical protein n=1 Tax=Faunimonas sp. B44 TaxID=3461493 RepID=UPI0040449905
MRVVLRLFLLLPLAYVGACLAGGFFLVFAVIGLGPDGAYLGAHRAETVLLVLGVAATAGAVAAVPALAAILAAEAFGIRSMLYYLLVGAAIGFGAGLFMQGEGALAAADARLFAATGTVAGLAFWLIAGRGAGMRQPVDSPVV